MKAKVTTHDLHDIVLNNKSVSFNAPAHARLSDVLRDQLGQNDVKIGCNAGDCGACSVLVDGDLVCACLMSVQQAHNKKVTTLQGLVADDPVAKKISRSFLLNGAAQCGICTPGMLVSATALLHLHPHPTEQQVKDALGGVLCRCTGYRKIIDAVCNASRLKPTQTVAGEEALSTAECLLNGESEHSGLPAVSSKRGGIGESIVRLDGIEKVTGRDCFGDDLAPADSLRCILVRSPYHHAGFEFGDIESFINANTGVETVLTAKDIPGNNRHGVIPPFIDQPVFAELRTRFKGEAVAAIVGDNKKLTTELINDFPISWAEEEPLLTVEQAQLDSASAVHAEKPDNVLIRGFVKRGDVDAKTDETLVSVSQEYTTDFIEHAYIEPEAGYATCEGNRVEVFGCTQTPFMNRDGIADILGIEATAVRMVASSTGGGFGSKLDLSWQPFVALAAWKLKKPVRITYTRKESMQSTTKRHPSTIKTNISANSSGKLASMTFNAVFNTGAYASWGPTVANRVPVHASGPYYVPNYLANTAAVYTHTVPAGAFRGFGVPQAAIAQECSFDILADKLGIDRFDFRLMNALDNNQPTVTGQTFNSSVGIKACLSSLETHWKQLSVSTDKFNAQAAIDKSPVRRGIGIACGWYGCGNTSLPNPSCIKAGIKADGTVCLHQGAVDIGQGANTVISQLFATALGIDVDLIMLVSSDTDVTPDAGKTSASRQTFVSGNAARLSGLAMRASILRLSNCDESSAISFANGKILIQDGNAPDQELKLANLPVDEEGYVLKVSESYDPPTKPLDQNGQGVPYAQFGYAAHLVELEVDTELGKVELLKFYASHDVGRAVNPNLIEGQIHGGIAQGIGLALMESFVPARTENLHDYLIPTIGDVPPIHSIIVEVPDENGPFGAKGLGEHVLIPTAPSILNAIRHACGATITHLPATPDRVLAAIDEHRTAMESST